MFSCSALSSNLLLSIVDFSILAYCNSISMQLASTPVTGHSMCAGNLSYRTGFNAPKPLNHNRPVATDLHLPSQQSAPSLPPTSNSHSISSVLHLSMHPSSCHKHSPTPVSHTQHPQIATQASTQLTEPLAQKVPSLCH